MLISIVSLVYRSPEYADAVYESVREFTPLLRSGAAEFHFVANDATDEVLRHLADRDYPHLVHRNPPRTEAELFAMGVGAPAYLHGVYRAWNFAVRSAPGEVVVLVNSDMMFSPSWLENLVRRLTPATAVSSQLVERRHPSYGVFPGAIERDFGAGPGTFDKAGFLDFCRAQAGGGTRDGGAYMPVAVHKNAIEEAGGYPEGNLHDGTSFDRIAHYGDRHLFARLARNGVRHLTATDSLVYHFKEGEANDPCP